MPVHPGQHDLLPQTAPPQPGQLSRIVVKRQDLFPTLVRVNLGLGPDYTQELGRRVEPDLVDLAIGVEVDSGEDGEFTQVEHVDAGVLLGTGREEVTVLAERQRGHGFPCTGVRVQGSGQGLVVPSVPNPDPPIVRTETVQQTIRVHGSRGISKASLESLDGVVGLDDRGGLQVSHGPSRIGRSDGDVAFRRMNGETDDIPLVTRHVPIQLPLRSCSGGTLRAPELDRLVGTARDDHGPLRGIDKFDLVDGLGVSLQGRQSLFTLKVVHLDRLVGTSRQGELAIQGEVESGDTGRLGTVNRGYRRGLSVGLDVGGLAVPGSGLSLSSNR